MFNGIKIIEAEPNILCSSHNNNIYDIKHKHLYDFIKSNMDTYYIDLTSDDIKILRHLSRMLGKGKT